MNNSPADRRSPLGLFSGESTARLYDRLVEVLRTQHYSLRSEEVYLHWLRRLLLFTTARIRANLPRMITRTSRPRLSTRTY